MLKKVTVVAGAFAALALAASLAGGETAPHVLKFATLAPKGSAWYNFIFDELRPAVTKATNGGVTLKVYPGGVMGEDVDVLNKMTLGQLHGGLFSAQGTSRCAKEMNVLQLPFLFNTLDEVEYVYRELRPALEAAYERNGFKVLMFTHQDFDYVWSWASEPSSLENLRKSKCVTWSGPLEQELYKRLGVSPVAIAVPEIPASLRSGVINVMVAPTLWIIATQLYSSAQWVAPIRIRYSPAAVVLKKSAWDQLPKEHADALDRLGKTMEAKYQETIRKACDQGYKAVLKYGVKETMPTAENLAAIKAKGLTLGKDSPGNLVDATLLKQVEQKLKEYRKGVK